MARLDTHWHANPKVLALGLDGMGLHSWSISYCDAELTDGFIPVGALPGLPRLKQAVNRLVDLGRWEVVEGGYRLHDYLQYNRSRDRVLTERAAAAERMQRARVRPNTGRTSDVSSGEVQPLPVPGPVRPTDVPGTVSPPVPLPTALAGTVGDGANGATPRASPPSGRAQRGVDDAIASLYGPRQQIERLPNGAQQCPLCPDIFTGSYSEHLDSPRHKIRPEPDDLSGFHA